MKFNRRRSNGSSFFHVCILCFASGMVFGFMIANIPFPSCHLSHQDGHSNFWSATSSLGTTATSSERVWHSVATDASGTHSAMLLEHQNDNKQQQQGPIRFHPGMVQHINQVPLQSTSHSGIEKQQLVDAFVAHPALSGVSIGILDHVQQQKVERHQHDSMSEFFFVLQGQGWVQVDPPPVNVNIHDSETTIHGSDSTTRARSTSQHTVQAGSFVLVGPHQNHSLSVSKSSGEPLKFLYFGLTHDGLS